MKTQKDKFLEKKIRTKKETKSSSDNSEEKTIIIIIIIALVILSALLLNLVVFTPAETELFSAIYYLDSGKMTTNLPKTVVLGENNTISLWVGVQNMNGTTMNYEVDISMDNGQGQINRSLAESVKRFEITLDNGETEEVPVTITINQLGQNRIIFDLNVFNITINEFQPSGKRVWLSVEAI